MELVDILIVAASVSTFANGYCTRRRYLPGMLASTFIAQIPLLVAIATKGIYEYGKSLALADAQGWTIAILYIVIIWGSGYILGGINIKKKDHKDDFPGSDIEHEMYIFD